MSDARDVQRAIATHGKPAGRSQARQSMIGRRRQGDVERDAGSGRLCLRYGRTAEQDEKKTGRKTHGANHMCYALGVEERKR